MKSNKTWIAALANALLLLAWCVFIFCMSAANGDASQSYSDGFSTRLLTWIDSSFATLSDADKLQRLSAFSFPVRKAAHFTEYLILGALAANLTRLLLKAKGAKPSAASYVAAWLLCVLFAGSDELHQLFIDGRSAQLFDVCVDSAGAALGAFAVFWIFCHLAKK